MAAEQPLEGGNIDMTATATATSEDDTLLTMATAIDKTAPVVEEAAAAIDEISDDDIRTFLGFNGKSTEEYEKSVEEMTRRLQWIRRRRCRK
jgi:uncharacterized protein Yka (UPF0111/DUF47 family)